MTFFYLVAIVLLSFIPTPIHAEDNLPLIRLSEIAPFVQEDDLAWIELYSNEPATTSLEGWYVKNAKDDVFPIEHTISPEQYLVVSLPYEEPPTQSYTETITLFDNQDTQIDQWVFPSTDLIGSSLILEENNIVETFYSTPGRPNIYQEELICLDEETNSGEEQDDSGNTSTVQPLESGAVIINEVFANPLGDETEGEFIELYNTENRSINLEQWIIEDASKSYIIEPVIIQPHDYLVLKRTTTSIALNNGNETVTLSNPFNKQVHQLTYEKANEGKSWNYQPIDNWYEQLPTPGSDNLELEVEEEDESENSDQGSGSDEDLELDLEEENSEEEEQDLVEPVLDSHLGALILTELMPNPVGSDTQEWIELYNPTSFTIDLAGLILADSTKEFVFEEGQMKPRSYFLVERALSSIALNNSNESISLFVDSVKTDTFSYEESEEGVTWARFDDEWEQTDQPTPEEENIRYTSAENEEEVNEVEQEEASDKKTTSANAPSTKKQSSIRTTSLDGWETIDDGEQVTISGTLIALPGMFQTRTALLQSSHLSSPIGLELYFHKADWPNLELGDEIIVSGEKSITQNGDRLLIREQEAIEIAENNPLTPLPYDEASHNTLAIIEGSLIEQSKKELLIDHNGEEIIVISAEDLQEIQEGSTVTVIGILKIKKGEKSLTPRTIDDIKYKKPIPLKPAQPETTSIPQIDHEKTNPLTFPIAWMGLSSSVTAIGVLGGVYRKRVMEVINKIRESRE